MLSAYFVECCTVMHVAKICDVKLSKLKFLEYVCMLPTTNFLSDEIKNFRHALHLWIFRVCVSLLCNFQLFS